MHSHKFVATSGGFSVLVNGVETQVITPAGAVTADIQATAGSIGTTELANSAVSTAKIADSAVTYAKRSSVAAVTATDDGLTTGLIVAGTTFATVTSDSATKAVTLPAITAAGIGQTLDIYVGATGYELLTPATSNNTISTVDSDGTNQLDVAANSLLRLVQVTATGWYAYQVTATTITVVAPDND